MTLPPRLGRCGTSTTASTSAWAVWMTRRMDSVPALGSAVRVRSAGTGLADPVDDLVRRGARREDPGHSEGEQRRDRALGHIAATEDDDVGRVPLPQLLENAREQRHLRLGEDRQPDGVDVLLHGRLSELLRRLVSTRVDDLHAGIPQRPGDDLGTIALALTT